MALNRFEAVVGIAMQIMGFAVMIFGGIGTVAAQAIMWLRDGEGTLLPIKIIWAKFGGAIPKVSWLGVQKLIDMTLDLPLSVALVACGAILAVMGAKIEAAR